MLDLAFSKVIRGLLVVPLGVLVLSSHFAIAADGMTAAAGSFKVAQRSAEDEEAKQKKKARKRLRQQERARDKAEKRNQPNANVPGERGRAKAHRKLNRAKTRAERKQFRRDQVNPSGQVVLPNGTMTGPVKRGNRAERKQFRRDRVNPPGQAVLPNGATTGPGKRGVTARPDAPGWAPGQVRHPRQKKKEQFQRARRERKIKRQDARAARTETREARRSRRMDSIRSSRVERRERNGRRVVIKESGGREIVREGKRRFIRNRDGDRLRRRARRVETEQRNGKTVTRVFRRNGSQIVTIRNRRGRLLRRVRITRNGRRIVLFNNTYRGHRHNRGGLGYFWLGLALPIIAIPTYHYIVDAHHASQHDLYDALSAPPVENLDDRYTLDEVRYNYPLRARMRSVDVNTINFEFGSWQVDNAYFDRLEGIASAIDRVIRDNENEVFLIEGHTDAVGSEEDNLSLSDRRAESVAVILTEEFGIPPENLVTQGYGEQFLRVSTQRSEPRNRRVTVRRITPLLSQREDEYSDAPPSNRGDDY